MTRWDIALIVVVSIMGTTVAYVRHPERKAFVLMLPTPLALGWPFFLHYFGHFESSITSYNRRHDDHKNKNT